MSESSLALFLQAVGGFRPPETLNERMKAFEQAARFCLKRKSANTIGHAVADTGDLLLIAKRDFGLNISQHRVCVQSAKDFLALCQRGPTTNQAIAALEKAA